MANRLDWEQIFINVTATLGFQGFHWQHTDVRDLCKRVITENWKN